MSVGSKYVFNPLRAFFARIATSASSTPPQIAAANAAVAAYNSVAQDVTDAAGAPLTANSIVGVASKIVGDAETGLNNVVAAYAAAQIAAIPVVGAVLAPELAAVIKAGMSFGEQHFHTFVADLFAHHNAVIDSMTVPTKIATIASSQPAVAPAVQPIPQPVGS